MSFMGDKYAAEELEELQKISDKVRAEAKKDPVTAEALMEADKAFDEITRDVFDFDSEDRVRRHGYTPQQAEDLAFLIKSQDIKVGQLFQFRGKSLVMTPFKTVVESQVYVTTIQDQVINLASEIEVRKNEAQILRNGIQEFTSLSFFGLIKLAFKRLRSK